MVRAVRIRRRQKRRGSQGYADDDQYVFHDGFQRSEILKKYLDSGKSGIEDYTSAVEYYYSISPQIFRQNKDGSVRQVNPDKSFESLGIGSGASTSNLMSSMMSTNVFLRCRRQKVFMKTSMM